MRFLLHILAELGVFKCYRGQVLNLVNLELSYSYCPVGIDKLKAEIENLRFNLATLLLPFPKTQKHAF